MKPPAEHLFHICQFLIETREISALIDQRAIEHISQGLGALRDRGGRLFIVGMGGSAANASHAAADFRKLAEIEAYCLSDNASELTARANDDGLETIYAEALKASKATHKDALLVLSVGGGTKYVSIPLVRAIDCARSIGMFVYGIVGRDGGYTKKHGDAVVVVPMTNEARVTPHTEGWQSVILHCLISHPLLQVRQTKW